MPNLATRIQSVTKDPFATLLLLRIRFWIEIAKKKYARDWTAQSMQALAKETGFSFDQVKRAVAKLRKLGLITTEQHLFHDKDGPKNMNHYRLTESGCALWFKGAEQGKSALPEQGKSALPEQGTDAPLLYIQGESTGSDNKEIPASALCAAADMKNFKIEDSGNETDINFEGLKSVHDEAGIVKAHKLHHKPNKFTLPDVWREKFKEATGKFCPTLTIKQVGQLKQFAKKCPSHMAETILCNVMEDWQLFAKDVEMNQGLKKTPYEPSVGFLLQYLQNAVSVGLLKSPKPVNKAQLLTPKLMPLQLISSAPVPPGDDFQTKEELLAFLNDVPAKGK